VVELLAARNGRAVNYYGASRIRKVLQGQFRIVFWIKWLTEISVALHCNNRKKESLAAYTVKRFTMDVLYEQLVRDMELAFDRLSGKVPAPQRVPFVRDRFVFRYVERTAQQAIIQKLARTITGLRAALLLLKNERGHWRDIL